MLPARPLLATLEREAIRQGYPGNQATAVNKGEGFAGFCEAVGICHRTVQRARAEGWIDLGTADRIAIALGLHPILVWPGEYETWLACEPPPDPVLEAEDRRRYSQWSTQRERKSA